MKLHVILTNQQLIALLEHLGYPTTLHEEVQYKCYPDHTCVPVIISTLEVKLREESLVRESCNYSG